MLKVGVIGLGFIGRSHYQAWQKTRGARLTAVCDSDRGKFKESSRVVGNIKGAAQTLDLKGVACFDNLDAMLNQAGLDAVSICLPTYMHPEISIKCLQAGLHVLCEKPMALSSVAGRAMLAAAKRARRRLMIAQVLRFVPEYAKAREIIKSGRHGKVLAATFQRLSATPAWSWKGWIVRPELSGGAALDLHIHDTDFVQYLFGMPRAVFSRSVKGHLSAHDHIVTQYLYPDRKIVTAEGGWLMAPTYEFRASFHVALEQATLLFDPAIQPGLRLLPMRGRAQAVPVKTADACQLEIAYFMNMIAGKKVPVITTAEQSCDSVRIVEAEIKSALSGKIVKI